MTNIYFETFGCSANTADTEQMQGLLKEAKFNIVDNEEVADIIILNTCTVKGPTESKILKRIQELKDGYKIIIIAGCMAQSEPKRFKEFPLIGTKQIDKVVEVVEEALNDNVIRAINTTELPPLNLPIVRKNPVVEIIPINRGCLGFCTFCKTKSARGNLQSYPIDQIITRAEKAIKVGVKEIWLTSQDTGCYGFDINTNLPTLLNELVKIEGDFKIRVGMMNPDHLIKILEPLIEVYKNPKIFKFLHLPIQAGNDKVLKDMKRLYKAEDFVHQIESFRKAIPNISIMTDIIVGFPGETEDEFFDTLTILRKTAPEYSNISKFWARPNTPAEKMENQVDGAEIKKRSQVTTDIATNISKLAHEKYFATTQTIIISKKGRDENEWVGFTDNYIQVAVDGNYKLGDKLQVKITKAGNYSLFGKDLDEDKNSRSETAGISLKIIH